MELRVKYNQHQRLCCLFKRMPFVGMIRNIKSILFQFNLQQTPFDEKYLCFVDLDI